MMEQSYFQWLASQTPTTWWHDSGDPEELALALQHGASGVTTNPVLSYQALSARPDFWRPRVRDLGDLTPPQRAEVLMHAVVTHAAAQVEPTFRQTQGAEGYACAQVNPARAGDREAMLEMARRFADWAPNIAVKLPVTAAGLDVLEECVTEGITVTATVSFTVPQVVAIAERHRRGAARAREAGRVPGHAFAVIMIGRLDDYVRDVAHDRRAGVAEDDIRLAGLAVTKRAYAIYSAKEYEAVLLVAALRGNYHMTELAGARLIVSVHPRNQAALMQPGVPREERIEAPVPGDAIERLCAIPEFVRAYEPDGMAPEDFITYGATQRTLSQFENVGWGMLEGFRL